ncbi:hypothetical protein [uncultured Alistipes sp.]|uniref:hypothetical protein n=1 Tax=uncultured Alistipes sp. TaxID=538949 RepID=UPI00272BEE22|nr:hypothetical protein [uncultured Alistipes sp.]
MNNDFVILSVKKMRPKFIARLGVKAYNDSSNFFQELLLSKSNPRTIEISSKPDDNGLLWTTKVTATLRSDHDLLHGPCIIEVRCMDCFYILGTEDIPCRPTIKEQDLVELSIEIQTKNRPTPTKKVLSYSTDSE